MDESFALECVREVVQILSGIKSYADIERNEGASFYVSGDDNGCIRATLVRRDRKRTIECNTKSDLSKLDRIIEWICIFSPFTLCRGLSGTKWKSSDGDVWEAVYSNSELALYCGSNTTLFVDPDLIYRS